MAKEKKKGTGKTWFRNEWGAAKKAEEEWGNNQIPAIRKKPLNNFNTLQPKNTLTLKSSPNPLSTIKDRGEPLWKEAESYLKVGLTSKEVADYFKIPQDLIDKRYTPEAINALKEESSSKSTRTDYTYNKNKLPSSSSMPANNSTTYPIPKRDSGIKSKTKTQEGNIKSLKRRTERNRVESARKKQISDNIQTSKTIEGKLLAAKLKGITDNSERYRIVDSFLKEREKVFEPSRYGTQTATGVSSSEFKALDGTSYATDDARKKANGMYLKRENKLIPAQPTTTISEIKDFIDKKVVEPFKDKRDAAKYASRHDGLTATFHGIPEVNPLTGRGIDATNLHKLDSGELEYWKKLQIAETAKSVRTLGANTNPFTELNNNITISVTKNGKIETELLSDVYRDPKYAATSGIAGAARSADDIKAYDGRRDQWQNAIAENEKNQIAQIDKQLAEKNGIKGFFNNADKEEIKQLKAAREELVARESQRLSGISPALIESKSPMPNRPSEAIVKKLASRDALVNRLSEITKSGPRGNDWSRMTGIKEEISQLNSQIDKEWKPSSSTIPRTDRSLKSASSKAYKVENAITGSGLGFFNSMAASRTEHAGRTVSYLNPIGASARETYRNAFGIATKQQRLDYKMSKGFLGKVGTAGIPAFALGTVGYSMYQGESTSEILGETLGIAGTLQGWRLGVAAGSALTSPGSLTRLAGAGVAGVLGAGALYAVNAALVEVPRDMGSNTSHIRHFAKEMSTKEMFYNMPDTNQSLTARQSALNKLAKSGLNDRAQLLGNEASILRGLY